MRAGNELVMCVFEMLAPTYVSQHKLHVTNCGTQSRAAEHSSYPSPHHEHLTIKIFVVFMSVILKPDQSTHKVTQKVGIALDNA